MRRAGAAIVGLALLAGPLQAGCLVFCDKAKDGRAYLETELTAPLPDDVAVVAFLEGGFQDVFIEAELVGRQSAIDQILQMMAIDPAGMKSVSAEGFGVSSDPVWSLTPGMALKGSDGKLGHFAFARAAQSVEADVDGRVRLFIFAYET